MFVYANTLLAQFVVQLAQQIDSKHTEKCAEHHAVSHAGPSEAAETCNNRHFQ